MSEKARKAHGKDGWELDLFSTMLSRKHSFHRVEGNLRLVKVRRASRENREDGRRA
ncbi:MAG: hypothetical protein WCY59_02740 [Anaerovoracaceae bacterium]